MDDTPISTENVGVHVEIFIIVNLEIIIEMNLFLMTIIVNSFYLRCWIFHISMLMGIIVISTTLTFI